MNYRISFIMFSKLLINKAIEKVITTWGFIIYLHEVIALIASTLSLPNFSTKNKTPKQIEENKKNAREFFKNFPILTATIIITHAIIAFYWLYINNQLKKNCFVFFCDDSGLKTIFYIAIYSIIIMISLYFILVKKEYNSSCPEFRKKEPGTIYSIIIFIYTMSICLGMTSVHFVNYYFNNQKSEEHIVTVTKNHFYTTKSGKNGHTVYHYEVYFQPPVNNIEKIDVSRSLKDLVQQGDKIKIHKHNGRYGIPYLKYNLFSSK